MKTGTKRLAAAIFATFLPAIAFAEPPRHYGSPFGFWYGISEDTLVGHVSGFTCASSTGARICAEVVRKDQWPPVLGLGAAICKPRGGATAYLKADSLYAMSCEVTEDTWRIILNKSLDEIGQPKIANDIFQSVTTTALEWKSGRFFYALLKTTGVDYRGRPVYILKFRIGDTPTVPTPNADVLISPMPVSPGAKPGIPFG